MSHITMRKLKEVTKEVVMQLVGNIQKMNTPEFQENFPYTYDGREEIATFEHHNGTEVITFDIYGIKTGFQLPLNASREEAGETIAQVYPDANHIGNEYLRINSKQIKAKYEKIRALSKLN